MKLHGLIFPEKIEFDKEKNNDRYGRFVAEPFERGYGQTVGSSLRRILLSSLQGAAVTAVRIPGCPHEYSSVRGVKEDVMGIILNLRQLRFKLYGTSTEILKLEVSKKGVITASDFHTTAGVEIINGDLVIANVEPGGKLQMEIEVSSGRGYVPAERNKKVDRPVDFIAMDAMFSPITKVYYDVENARVGQITDYDRLVLEIWTDGSVAPLDALSYAAGVMKDSVFVFLPSVPEQAAVLTEDRSAGVSVDASDIRNRSVSDLNLSVRAANCLKNAKISLLGDLVNKTEEDLLNYKNFGKVSLVEIREKLEEMGLSLGMDL